MNDAMKRGVGHAGDIVASRYARDRRRRVQALLGWAVVDFVIGATCLAVGSLAWPWLTLGGLALIGAGVNARRAWKVSR